MPGAIGMRTRRSVQPSAAALSPAPSAPTHQRDARSRPQVGGHVLERLRTRLGCQADEGEAGGLQVVKRFGPGRRPGERDAQRRPHRRADGLAIERVAAAGPDDHRMAAKRRHSAENPADVVDVAHSFEHDHARDG